LNSVYKSVRKPSMAPSTSTLSSASPDRLVMLDPEITAQDQQHQQQLQQHHLQQHEIEQDHQELAVLPKPVGRKRKKSEGNQNEMGESQPRRLRRLHEACARCRSKKIKVSLRRFLPCIVGNGRLPFLNQFPVLIRFSLSFLKVRCQTSQLLCMRGRQRRV
jgi:hypothetical protein